MHGQVKLRFGIDATGHVVSPVVLDSRPTGLFDTAALQAVLRWVYAPRKVAGKPSLQPDNVVVLHFEPAPPAPQEALVEVTPYYPRAAYVAKIEGDVGVSFNLTSWGAAENVRVLVSSTRKDLDAAALRAVSDLLVSPESAAKHRAMLSTTIRFRLKDANLEPVPLTPLRPTYPVDAESAGVVGACSVEYWIEKDGRVTDPKILICYPEGVFDQASLRAVRRATYEPESDPAFNRRRRHVLRLKYRIESEDHYSVHYLKTGQWIKLGYTLTARGHPTNIVIVAKSSPDIEASKAVEQLRSTVFEPVVRDGVAVEKTGLEAIIHR